MISRRRFIKTLAGMAPILGGAGLCLASPFWERLLSGESAGTLFALDVQSDMVRSAPKARWWTSVSLAGTDCRQCHPSVEELKGKRIRHEAGLVKCLLCAQGCVIKTGGRGRCRARILFFVGRLFPAWRRGLLVAAAGFIGIACESVLLLAYQSKEGALYQDIGLLLMMFMAGLAVGAWLLNEAIRWTGLRRHRTRWWGGALLVGFCILGAAVIGSVQGMLPGGLITTALLIAAAGFFVAGVLAYAGLYRVRDQQTVIAPLYTADLLGGCLGSLLGSLVLIPLFGLDGAVLGMILLAALSALLI